MELNLNTEVNLHLQPMIRLIPKCSWYSNRRQLKNTGKWYKDWTFVFNINLDFLCFKLEIKNK